jgi:hypothetical protein
MQQEGEEGKHGFSSSLPSVAHTSRLKTGREGNATRRRRGEARIFVIPTDRGTSFRCLDIVVWKGVVLIGGVVRKTFGVPSLIIKYKTPKCDSLRLKNITGHWACATSSCRMYRNVNFSQKVTVFPPPPFLFVLSSKTTYTFLQKV